MPPSRRWSSHRTRALAVAACVLASWTCDQQAAGPGRRAVLAVEAQLPATDLAAFNLTIDNARLIVVNTTGDTVFDKTFSFPANQSSLPVSADIPLEASPATFHVTIQLLSGTTLLFEGTQDVTLTGETATPVQVPVTYSGPGQNVASLTIDPADSSLSFGASLTFRPTARDAQGNPVASFYVSWTTSDTMAAPIDATGTLVAPVARQTVTVTAHTPNNVSASTPITFAPVATGLGVVSGCGQTGAPGALLPQPIVARVVAADGLGVKDVAVTFTPPTGGSVSPALAVTDASGLAQTTATLGATPGPASFTISAGGLTPATCVQTVLSQATQLAFTTQPPASAAAGAPFSVAVTARDTVGNPATGFTGNVTLALSTNPGGASFTPVTVAAVAGVATFTGLRLDKVGTGYSLSASATGLPAATSTPLTITPGTPARLVFAAWPTTTFTAGVPITPVIMVAVADSFANMVTTATNTVTVSLGANPGGATLGGTTSRAAVAGVATYNDLTIDSAGTGYTLVATSPGLTPDTSRAFDVSAGVAATLAFVSQPTSIVAGGGEPVIQVSALDGQGNVATGFTGSVTMALGTHPAGASLSGTFTVSAVSGVATFSNLAGFTVAGSYTLVATSGSLSVESAPFTVSAGAASQVAFTVQPSNAAVAVPITPPVVVTVDDAFGNPVLTATNAVSLAIGSNPGAAVLGGTVNQTAVAGVASFPDLSLDQVGTGYTLVASAAGLTPDTSSAFAVTAGGARQLAVNVTPASDTAGAPRSVVVTARDSLGNTATGYRGTVHFTATDTQAVLPADYTFTAADNGAHSFSGVVLKTAGAPSLTVTDLANGAITGTQAVAVSPASAAALVFISEPSTVAIGVPISPAVAVEARDAYGNLATTFGATITVAIGANPGGASLGGTTSQPATAGVATFADLTLNQAGTGYTLTTSATGLANGTSTPFDVTLVGAAPNAWTNAAGGVWSVPGNWSLGRVPAPTDSVVISLAGTYTVTLDTTVSISFLTFGAGSGTQTLALSSRTLSVSAVAGVEIGSAATLNGGTLAAGGVVNQGTLTLGGTAINGALANDGTLIATGASQLAGAVTTVLGDSIIVRGNGVLGAATLSVTGGSWTNNGAIVLTDVTASYGATLSVPSGTLTNATGATIEAALGTNGNRSLNASLSNQGTVTVATVASGKLTIAPPAGGTLNNASTISVASGTLQITQTGTNPSVTNSGTLQVSGGSVTLSQPASGTVTTSGAVTIAGGQTFTVSGGALTIPAGAVISGAGTLALSGATVSLAPTFNTGSTGLSLLNSTLNGTGTLTNAAGVRLNMQNSTIAVPFVNQGTLIATGASHLTGSVTSVAGDSIIVQGNGSFGAATLTTSGGSWTNNGAIVLTDVTSSYGATLSVPTGTLTNASGATIEAALGTNGNRTLSANLTNQGTLVVATVAAGRLTITPLAGGTLSNPGTITVASGTLQVTQTGTNPSATNSGILQLTGGNLTLTQPSGTGAGTLTTSGALTIGSGRTLTVSGGYLAVPTGATITGAGTLALSGDTATVTPNFTTGATGLGLLNSGWSGTGTLTNAAGVTLNLQNSTIASAFVNAGTLVATGASRLTGTVSTVAGDSMVVQGNGSFGAASLTVTDANGLTNNGAIVLTDVTSSYGASLNVPNGVLTNPAGSTIEAALGTNGNRTISATLDNAGTLTVAPAAASKLTITPPAGGEFNNSGTTTVKTGTLQVTLSGANPIVTNSGTVHLTGGDFALTQPSGTAGGTLATLGTLTIDSGRTFSVTGGVFQVPSGAVITNAGLLALSSDTAAVTPNFFTGPTGLSLLNSVWLGSGILTNDSGATLKLQNSEIQSSLSNAGTMVATGKSLLSGGVGTAPGDSIIVQGDGVFGAATLTVSNGGWTNNGAIVLTDVTSSYGATLSVPTGSLTNAPGATLQSLKGAGGARTLAASLINNGGGTVTVSQALTLSLASASHANEGLITLAGGDFNVVLSGTRPGFSNDSGTIDVGTNTMAVTGTGTFLNQSLGTLRGSGTFDVSSPTLSFLTNGITTVGGAPGVGLLTFVGTYIMGPTGSINVEIGGTPNPGVTFDELHADSIVFQSGGTLNAADLGGTTGNNYPVLTSATPISGGLQVFNIPSNCTPVSSSTQYVLQCR